ncbi:DUF1189 domain-containing protein [Oceanobacillus piezotolerans]|uniref:DUF1189 domain-containing protein n=1 Tax=Oceanobacillus piezotolerans TaxID=2448030 RepID=A0A498D797_9BACI|nr:DUF1189 family protein [Oceanobacillus piezotolerans]RLL41754.1 DUF1189 domain-containing protein [Oceanobacillus piezotolerans]
MIFWRVLVNSIKLPKKDAMFQLNRVGLDIAVVYNFILIFIISIPSLIERLTISNGFGSEMNVAFTFIYFFMFYYLPLTVIIFITLSLIAYIGSLIAKIMKRKLHYSLLWKMCSFTTTIPFLLYIVLSLAFPVNDIYLFAAFLYTIILLVRMISIYPKRRERK